MTDRGAGEAAQLRGELEELKRDALGTNLLLGLGAALSEVKSVEETIDFAVKLVPDALGGDRCFAALRDPSTGGWIVAALSGYDDAGARLLHERAAIRALPLVDRTVALGATTLIEDIVAEGLENAEDAAERRVAAAIGIPLIRWGQAVGALIVTYAEIREFTPDDQGLARAVARQIAIALANARRFALLGELRTIGLRVGSKLRLTDVTDELAIGATQLLNAAAGRVYFADADGRELVATGTGTAVDVDEVQSAEEVGDVIDLSISPWDGLLNGDIVTLAGGQRNAVFVPITRPDGSLDGAIVVFVARSLPLGAEEEKALSVLSAQAASALETARRFEHQRRVAMTLQRGLIAFEIPRLNGYEIGALYEAATAGVDVGGDFYDIFEITNDSYGIVVGDVSGKGAEAAAQTAMAKYMLRAFAMRNASPKSVMFHLNNALVESFADDRFATICYATVEPQAGHIQLTLAGHPEPLVYRAASGKVITILPRGSLLGSFPDLQFEYETIEMAAGDILVVYTDGLVEARQGNDLYGVERASESLRRHASAGAEPQDLVQLMHRDALEYGDISDDTIVFALACKK